MKGIQLGNFEIILYGNVILNSVWLISYLCFNADDTPSELSNDFWTSVAMSLIGTLNGVYIAVIVMLHNKQIEISLAKKAMFMDCFLYWCLFSKSTVSIYQRYHLLDIMLCSLQSALLALTVVLLTIILWYPFALKCVFAVELRSYEKEWKRSTFEKLPSDENPA